MFERLTPALRAAVMDAQERARAMGHDALGDDHFLLALAASDGVVGEALRASGLEPAALEPLVRRPRPPRADREALASIGIDLDAVIARVEAVFGPGALTPRSPRARRRRAPCADDPPRGHLPLTARAKECLQLALLDIRGRREAAIDVPDLALALTALQDGPARAAMTTLGVPPGRVRAAVLDRCRRAG
jgi:Clp amino terminal domain, pathogenicity island component